ncbi:PREDICTED: magnesium-dependent phosphatase 1-like isoform X2 [Nicrophorus vespilloides]|uniref:Magnesium-dependent phosphatase 1-like isoform X2 n=1 Tax=Nicrophorus vespilloides TaxID=110193 RepID=A0ABM1M3G8_NICVS|nr:PREDICTED: magnesium-dependent phosphatase 1-like isoform X2 [Nicrophorus vespilloides]
MIFREENNAEITSGEVLDAHAQKVKHYPEVPRVLETLKRQGYILGIASRTGEIDGANQLLQLFNWDKYFTYKQIYPGCKVNHFNKIRKDSGIEFDEIIFFDDEQRNIQDLTRKGVMSVLVKSGVNAKVVDDAIANFGS